jgi:hypothetical protein
MEAAGSFEIYVPIKQHSITAHALLLEPPNPTQHSSNEALASIKMWGIS